MADPYDLERFVHAQDEINPEKQKTYYSIAEGELLQGRKTSDWVWFIFPQMLGLAPGERSKFFGIGSREEAVAYVAHDVLGPRLTRCAELVIKSGASTAVTLMRDDCQKLKSSMTLFAEVVEDNAAFLKVLRRYYTGTPDRKTLALLGPRAPATPPERSDSATSQANPRRGPSFWRNRGDR